MKKSEEYNLILDFDGTITNIHGNWQELKTNLGFNSLSEYWRKENKSEKVANAISEFEIANLTSELVIPIQFILNSFEWSVLTNNSSNTVKHFLSKANLISPGIVKYPNSIIGREELGGPKEDFEQFDLALTRILQKFTSNLKTIYVGDSEYELRFARSLGLTDINVKDLLVDSENENT